MPQFDLKKATVYFEDGYTEVGAVNNGAGYPAAAVTMTIDAITGLIPVGATFVAAGDDQVYTVTAQTPTLGNTTSITFTPGLVLSVADDDVLTFSGRRLELKVGEGNLTYSEKRTMEYKRDRGVLETVREGDEEPIDVRLDLQWEWLSYADTDTVPTPEEVLKRTNLAASWESSQVDDDPCAPYSVNIIVHYIPDCEGVDAEIIKLPHYRWEELSHDLRQGTLSTSGKCNVTRATVTRKALIAE